MMDASVDPAIVADRGGGGWMGVFAVLINPEKEERQLGERGLVCSAANMLQISEWQFLKLAYRNWFAEDLPEPLLDGLFTGYMLRNDVPHWARHYARLITAGEAAGLPAPVGPPRSTCFPMDSSESRTLIDDNKIEHLICAHPGAGCSSHRAIQAPAGGGAKSFCIATGVVALALAAAITAASTATTAPTSILPPYFERGQLPGGAIAPSPAAEEVR